MIQWNHLCRMSYRILSFHVVSELYGRTYMVDLYRNEIKLLMNCLEKFSPRSLYKSRIHGHVILELNDVDVMHIDEILTFFVLKNGVTVSYNTYSSYSELFAKSPHMFTIMEKELYEVF